MVKVFMGEAKQEQLKQEQSGVTDLPIEWHFPEGMLSRYANSVLVRAGLYEMTIAFLEVQWPDLLDKEFEELEATRVECVGKIIVRTALVPALIDMLECRPESHQQLEKVPSPGNWDFSEGIPSRYANNMIVQAGQCEAIISFFETQLPIVVGNRKNIGKQIEKLRLDCVGKISVPPQLLPVLIKALKSGLERHDQLKRRVIE